MRIKSKWFNSNKKTLQEMASAVAFSCWRLSRNQIEDLINEGFKIEKQQIFATIKAYLYFSINCIDRLVFNQLTFTQRQEFMTALVKQCAFYYQENKADRIAKGEYIAEFIYGYNEITLKYSKCDFDLEPDYNFLKVFASSIKDGTTKVDEKWIEQQIIEIQAPSSIVSIKNFIHNIINVKNIINKQEKSLQIKSKESRAKRQKTAKFYNKKPLG